MATLFERLLTYLRERGLVSAGGRQRTDATHILGAVKRMGDVEVVREAVRLAIIGLMSSDAKWTMQNIPVSFIHSYKRSWPNYRMGQGELDELIQNTREEARWLLNQIAMLANIELQQLPEIRPLARIWEEQFQYVDDPERPLAVRSGKEDQTNRIRSPHDPDVTYGMKGNGALTWLGYKVHITETIEQPRFITDVRLTASSSREITDLGAIQQDLIEHQLRPTQHYVDQGSMSGEIIAESQERGIDLRGRIGPDTQGKPPGFRLEDFDIDLEAQVATCPAGRPSRRWLPTPGNIDNRVAIHIFFGKQCLACPFFGVDRCTNSKGGRHLSLNAFHEIIQARRKEEQTEPFQQELRALAALEGPISEMVRAYALRRGRY